MPFITRSTVLCVRKAKLYFKVFLARFGIKSVESRLVKGIVLADKNLGYKDIPKTACTSIKLALYQLVSNKKYNDDENEGLHIHQYMQKKVNSLNDCQFRFIVIRDPIKRFLSAYSNRVIHHKELSREYVQQEVPNLINEIPCFDPSLDEFIKHFSKYCKVPSIQHHFRPVSQFINYHSLNYFTHVYPIEKLGEFEEKLSEIYSSDVKFPRGQTGGPKIKTSELTSSQLEIIREIYFDDYVLLRNYYQ